MYGIQAVSAQVIAHCLWFSIFTTSTPCGYASHVDLSQLPKRQGMLPFFDLQGTGQCEPWGEPFVLHEYNVALNNTVPLAGAVLS